MLTSPLGALVYGYILDKWGRKYTLLVINILSIISWSTIALSSTDNSESLFYQILFGRMIHGIVNGLSSGSAAVYSAEIAFPKLRGRLIAVTSFAIAFGILIIYMFGYFLKVIVKYF